MLTFRNVQFAYKRNRNVLENLNLNFKQGRTLLLGPNGSGKSTIFGLASGSLLPKSGKITTDERIGLLPQKVPVFPNLNVQEQVAYVAWLAMKTRKASDIDAVSAIAAMKLTDKALEKPKNLSGGQLRRLGIAGLLNSDVDILLLDEPTAGLDIAQCTNFFQTLKSLPSGKTVVVCTHQLDGITDYFDYVCVIKSGQLVFDGTIAEFIKLGNLPDNQITTNPLVNAYTSLVGVDA
jgi:ABC-type multidrug transport system ATPase subunit